MSYIPRRPGRSRPDFSLAVVNIVFLLLLFYLATGSLIKPAELAADAPLTSDLPLDLLPRPLLLVAADGSLFLDGAAAAAGEIAGAAAEAGILNVLADRDMAGREFLDVLARIDTGGAALRIVSLHRRGGEDGGGP